VPPGADSDTRGASIDYMQPIPGSEQSNLGAYLAAPEPMTDTYSSNAVHSVIGQPITQEAALQAAEMGDYATVLDFASQNTSQYNFDGIAVMPDERGYFERIGSELQGGMVVDQPLGERLENAAVAAYYGDPNNKLDGIESRVLSAKGLGRSFVDGLQELAQDPFGIIRDPVILGYDQIQTAFYYGTGGLLGNPNSVARNHERSESLFNFFEAAETSVNDPEKATYLFGGAILGLRKGKYPDAQNKLTTRSFNNLDDFNEAANAAKPNTRYEYGSYSWTTDASGRVAQVEGQLVLKPHGRTGQSLQTQIGNEGLNSDVGFHLIGDQFDGPINRLNVVQGNGKPINGLKNLNTSAYAKLERIWKQELVAGNPVKVRINTSYSGSSVRPDEFSVWYQVGNNRPRTATLLNQAGSR
jgi:hypothetical protein